jgi:c-di-GMP-binding flagellar brake protein YcgR
MVDEQKRRFVRIDVILPVKYRTYTGNPLWDQNFSVGRTINLSSGGMMLAVNMALAPEAKLDMELELNDKTRLYLVGKVLGGEDMMVDGVSRRIEKINFLDLDDESRDIIMKFIFNRQRAELRKGQAEGKG